VFLIHNFIQQTIKVKTITQTTMRLFKRSRTISEPSTSAQDVSSRKSIFELFSSQKSRVTEATLQVWRNLPGEIRHDPSMVCFQREAERWKGK
jgi:hypothetical protein